MSIRLPKDSENWLPEHAERAYAEALRLFDRYEARVDFERPKEEIDELYRPYQLAREQAVTVARHVNWMVREAERLP